MSYSEIYQESINNKEGFWKKQAEQVVWFENFEKVLEKKENSFYRWFSGGKINACYNAIDRHVKDGYGDSVALIYHSEMTGKREQITYQELQEKVSRCAGALKKQNIQTGDRVLVYMPMVSEAIVAILACARLGAIHSVVFGGFAAKELANRILDAKPKLIFTASCGLEPQKIVVYQEIIEEALKILPESELEKIVVLQRKEHNWKLQPNRDLDWEDFLENAPTTDCVPVDSSHPLYILYTSGTTGKPKGIVRDTGGYLVALKYSMENIYDIREGEVWWSASDIGWVVGHSYIIYAPLLHRCTTILFEGKPVGTPDPSVFWKVIHNYGVVSMFTAPTAIRAIKKEDPEGKLAQKYPMDKFRVLYLAGERCDTDTLHWSKKILSTSVIDNWWQTETGWPIASIPMGIEKIPVKAGSCGLPVCGYNVRILDDEAKPVPPKTMGNICIELPLPPGTLLTLWNNDQGCEQSYFSKFAGYYQTGDAGYLDEDNYLYVMSRTDDIINVAGHRLSTGAIEEVIANHESIAECAVTGVKHSLKGEIPFGFLVLKSGVQKTKEKIAEEIVALVREKIGPVATFKELVVVAKLPKTRSGKILRKILRAIINQEEYRFPSTIEDASVLDDIKQLFSFDEENFVRTSPFQAWVIEKKAETSCSFKEIEHLPKEGVELEVAYSTLNYKDALALLDIAPIAKSFPMVPGIDLAGKVISKNPKFAVGSEVFVNGWGVGEKYWGGLAQKAKIPLDYLQEVPKGLEMKSCMALGTAGYTAMLCIFALLQNKVSGKIAVSGASGGVGNFAVFFLAKMGFEVVAFTGSESQFSQIKNKGANEVLLRSELEKPSRPLEKAQWGGVVDTVGGNVLSSLLARIQDEGTAAICGLTGGSALKTAVMPFILRGVKMMGVNSVTQPMEYRQKVWEEITKWITPLECEQMSETIALEQAQNKAQELMDGGLSKRIIVQI